MNGKRLYIHVIISGVLILLATLFLVIAVNMMEDNDIVSSAELVLIGVGTICFICGMANILYTVYKVLKDKKII